MLTILPEQDKQKSGERLNTAYAASGYEKESGKDPALLVVREGAWLYCRVCGQDLCADLRFPAVWLYGLPGYGRGPVGIL